MAEFDYSEAISEARAKYESISKALDVDRLTAEAKDLEVKAAEPGLWDDPENAQKVTSKLSAVQSQLKRLASADQRIEDVETLVELGQEEEDADTLAEAKAEVESIQKDLDDMEIQTLLDGEYDERSAVVTIRSGAGGVDAADFAQMLLRMYLRWAERNGYKAKVMDTSYASFYILSILCLQNYLFCIIILFLLSNENPFFLSPAFTSHDFKSLFD